MRLLFLSGLRRLSLYIAKWCSARTKSIKEHRRKKMMDRILILSSKDKMSKREKVEFEKLMESFDKDDVIIL